LLTLFLELLFQSEIQVFESGLLGVVHLVSGDLPTQFLVIFLRNTHFILRRRKLLAQCFKLRLAMSAVVLGQVELGFQVGDERRLVQLGAAQFRLKCKDHFISLAYLFF
jgi:hypothetical protein